MTDTDIASPEIEPPKRSAWRNLSLVWLVPILALAVALGVAYQSYADRGTLIEITFLNASGVVAGDTTVRYRDVVIGRVEDLSFTEGLGNVIVSARVDAQVLPFMDEDATFWVVRPEISSQGVTGLSTVVSGVYIEGAWDGVPGEPSRTFEGRDAPLLVLPGQAGRRVTLELTSAQQLNAGAPVFFRGLQVGSIEQPMLTEDARAVRVNAFIESPYDRELSGATRFWNASGFEVRLGTEGITLDVPSLTSLLNGGITFANIYSGGDPLEDDRLFTLYDTEAEARASAFAPEDVGDVPVTVEFSEFVEGVEIATPVDYRGLQVGEVTDIRIISTAVEGGARKQRLAIDMVLDAGRMGLPRGTEADALYDLLERLVDGGLRAQVGAAGLLSTTVRVSLTEVPAPAPARLAREAEPFPVIPSVPARVSSFDATAEGLLDRLSALPFEATLNQIIATLAAVEDLAEDPSLRAVPTEVAGLLTDARGLVTGEATGLFTDARALVAGEAATLLNDAREVLAGADAQAIPAEALGAISDLRSILTDLQDSGALEALASVAAQADTAMGPIVEASDALPEIAENLRALSETAAALELEVLLATANDVLGSAEALVSGEVTGLVTDARALVSEEATALLDGARAVLTGPEAQAVPGAALAAIADLRALLTAFEDSGTIASIASAAAQADAAMGPVVEASDALPEIMANFRTLSERAAALEIDALIATANSVLASADAFISSDEMAEVPAALSGALIELERLISELTAADVAGSLVATLDAAETATEGLPALVEEASQAVSRVDTLIASYGARSDFMAEGMSVLREIRTAARAISQLARTIERNPQALLTGR